MNTQEKLLNELAIKLTGFGEQTTTLAHLLSKLDKRLSVDKFFIPAHFTLTAGTPQVVNAGLVPDGWFVRLDPRSTTALLEVYANDSAGDYMIVLSPGESMRFPARWQAMKVRNAGTGSGEVSVFALGDSPFEFNR